MKNFQHSARPGVLNVVSAAILTAILAWPAFAGPQLTSTYGDQLTWFGAEAAAMGGTGTAVYRGGLSNVFNPALLVAETGQRLDAGVALDQSAEDRFQPLFDSFDSYVTDVAIASNRHHFWQTGFAWARKVGTGPRAMAVAVSLADRFPYGYAFEEELLNPSPFPPGSGEPARDMRIAYRERKVTGALRALSFGAAAEVGKRVSIGAAAHYNFGTRRDAWSSLDTDNAGTNGSWSRADELKLHGVNATAGLRAVLSPRVDLGVAIESTLRATGDWRHQEAVIASAAMTDTTVGSYLDYPWCVRAGLALRPRNELPTVFTVEVEYRPWSELRDGSLADPSPLLRDVADVRLGVEHVFYNGMPLRFGFRHLNSYADRDAGMSAFTAGTAAAVGRGKVAVSVELSKLNAVQLHQFTYPADYFGDAFVTDPTARVEDTRFRVGASYTMEF